MPSSLMVAASSSCICADEKILDDNGNVDLKKFNPICYDPSGHGYYKLGEKVGQAFSDGKKLS